MADTIQSHHHSECEILQVKLASPLRQRLTLVIISCSLDVGRSSPMASRAGCGEGIRCRTESIIPGK